MPQRISQPTKEQVRAYMTAREAARRPPPAPDEIRRLLGWRRDATQAPLAWVELCLMPGRVGQIFLQLVLDCLMPVHFHNKK